MCKLLSFWSITVAALFYPLSGLVPMAARSRIIGRWHFLHCAAIVLAHFGHHDTYMRLRATFNKK